MLILLLPFLLINSVRNLKKLAPFSTLGNFLTVVSFGIIAYYVFSDIPPLSQREAFAPISVFPLYFGTVLFAMEAIGVVSTARPAASHSIFPGLAYGFALPRFFLIIASTPGSVHVLTLNLTLSTTALNTI